MREPCVDQPMIAPARHPRIDEPVETRRQIFDHTARLPSPRTGNGWHHPQSAAGPMFMREPWAVDDYVAADNPVRFIEAFVDSLDLAAAGFARVQPKATGRPGYAPADLLKLYIYGYLNRTRSSRRLEAETHRNIEVIWLLRHLRPDFKTIADFRRINHKALYGACMGLSMSRCSCEPPDIILWTEGSLPLG